MSSIIIIDPKKFNVDFEDITAFKIIDFLFNNSEYDGWEWSSSEDLNLDLRIEFLDLTDEGIQSVILLDFDKEEIRLVDLEITVKEETKKIKTISIKKVK